MEAKDQWIKQTMESLDGAKKAEASPFLYEKVMQRLQGKPAKVISFRRQAVWRVAASVVILAGLNLYTCIHYTKAGQSSVGGRSVAAEYFSYLDNTIQF